MTMPRMIRAFEQIDAANAADPRQVQTSAGPVPEELLYGRRMSQALERFEPASSELLQLAVRAQHIERWKLPRQDFPAGKAGYHRWRTEQKRRHAEVAGAILHEAGYTAAEIGRVGDLIMKKGLGVDPEAQTLEDVACLVFLEHYSMEFAADKEREKTLDILAKTWRKMSPRARAAALALQLPPALRSLVEEAVSAAGQR